MKLNGIIDDGSSGIIDIKNKSILRSLQKILNDFTYVTSVDLHLQECYPSLYKIIYDNLTFRKNKSRPTKLICQNLFESWEISSDNPTIIDGGRAYMHTSFCSFLFDNKNVD